MAAGVLSHWSPGWFLCWVKMGSAVLRSHCSAERQKTGCLNGLLKGDGGKKDFLWLSLFGPLCRLTAKQPGSYQFTSHIKFKSLLSAHCCFSWRAESRELCTILLVFVKRESRVNPSSLLFTNHHKPHRHLSNIGVAPVYNGSHFVVTIIV